MYFLIALSLFVVSYISSISAAPSNRPLRRSCGEAIPVLKSEPLYVDNHEDINRPVWNLKAIDDSEGGTRALSLSNPLLNSTISREWASRRAGRRSPAGSPQRRSTYLRDQVSNLTTFPWNTIGRVFFKRYLGDKGGWCTGSLVGRNLLLTASHCFPWGYGKGRSMRFVPGYGSGVEPYGASYVSRCRGVKNTFNVTGIDYVVCQLCRPLGDQVGWMGTKWWKDGDVYMNRSWSSTGYPIDSFHGRTQMLIPNISLINIDYHGDIGIELESHVFASPGWSGGPMWGYIDGEAKIVGVCSGGEKQCSEQPGGCRVGDTGPYHDVSAGGKLMTDLILHGIDNWEPLGLPGSQNEECGC